MKGTELIINFESDRAYLTEGKFLMFKQLNLPSTIVKFQNPASLKVRVLKYLRDEKRLFVEILSYSNRSNQFLPSQIINHNSLAEINEITLKNQNTMKLLAIYTPNQSYREIKSVDEKAPEREVNRNSYIETPRIERTPQKIIKNEILHIPIEEVRFHDGYVSINAFMSVLRKNLELKILNVFIRKEFDSIKNYIAKVLKVKKFKFEIKIHLTDNKIDEIQANCFEVSQINQSILEDVKFEFIKIVTKSDSEIEVKPYTFDELMEVAIGSNIDSKIFYKNEQEFINDLLKNIDAKHYNSLLFLSGIHSFLIMKLKFFLKPFSYIFFVEAEHDYYFIWETYNTEEATYIWRINKGKHQLENAVNYINDEIKNIKINGKRLFLKLADENFTRIYHDYSDANIGFLKWKNELEGFLK
ncbi:MAG: hypothetical protein GC192_20425 [Bacteroidetes bacterium]|nr:hypothetical protein [Bacteroidota bacterium]